VIIDSTQSSFSSSDLPISSSGYKYDDSGLSADNLINSVMGNTGLTSETVNDPGRLRISEGGARLNRMYGDALCEKNGENYAQWHLCTENLPQDKRSFSRNGNSYNCNIETGNWVKQ